jgi:hypothetical protein
VRNPAYQGDLMWGRARYRDVGKKRGKRPLPEHERVIVRDAVPALVSRAVWVAAQEHRGRRFGAARPYHHPYLLSGLVTCGGGGRHFQGQKQYRGRVPAYYVCGGYMASGAALCPSTRIPTTYLDDAVIDGTQKRLERVVDADELRRRLDALLPARQPVEDAAGALEAELRVTASKIDRLVAALAAGPEDLPSLRSALVALERERGRLADDLRAATARRPGGAEREAIVTDLIASLGNVRAVLDEGTPEERKTVVRNFLAEAGVERSAGRILLRWYRVPFVSGVKLVAVGGIEPPTRGL